MNDLLTLADISKLYGINYNTLRTWKMLGHLPPPVGKVGKSQVWRRKDIENWYKERPEKGRESGTR